MKFIFCEVPSSLEFVMHLLFLKVPSLSSFKRIGMRALSHDILLFRSCDGSCD